MLPERFWQFYIKILMTYFLLVMAPQIQEYMKTECLYATQLRMQAKEIDAFRNKKHIRIPDWIDYSTLPMISNEEKEKLSEARPSTIHAASRISGVRSATLLLLYQYATRQRQQHSSN